MYIKAGFRVWAGNYLISSRSDQKGLNYAMEEHIQKLKIQGDKLEFSCFSGLPHSLPQAHRLTMFI